MSATGFWNEVPSEVINWSQVLVVCRYVTSQIQLAATWMPLFQCAIWNGWKRVRLGYSLWALLGRPRQRFYSWLANWRAVWYVWYTKSDTPESVPELIVIIYYGWILLVLPCPGVTFCCICFRKMLLYMWKCLIAYSFISCLVINSWFLYFDTTLSIAAHILILLYYMSFSKGDSPLLMIFWSREMEQWVFCTFKSSPTCYRILYVPRRCLTWPAVMQWAILWWHCYYG